MKKVTTVHLERSHPKQYPGMDKNKINKGLGLVLLVLLVGFLVVLMMQLLSLAYTPATSTCTKQVCLQKFLDGPPSYDDEYMARFLRSKYITPPSSGPLNLQKIEVPEDSAFVESRQFIQDYFKDRRNGRFLVLGAGDGQYEDMSLGLEDEKGWTGLLVEHHPQLHQKLIAKQRNAEVCSACVSPFSYPTMGEFAYPSFEGTVSDLDKMMRYRETKLYQLWDKKFKLETFKSQCIPLVNIIYASETITDKIDLMVLDMAGSDLDILLSTNLDWLPEIEVVLVVAHGSDIATEVGGYFMEKNMVVSKVFGNDVNLARFVIMKFEADSSLID